VPKAPPKHSSSGRNHRRQPRTRERSTLITTLKESFPDILCVVITGAGEVEHAIEALRRGAFDYLLKPLHPLETLSRLEKCFDKIALQERAEKAEAANEAKSAFWPISA